MGWLGALNLSHLDELYNDQKRRILAAAADFALFIGGHDKSVKGHKKDVESSWEKLYDQFFSDRAADGEQICSEWASKATLAAMMKVNEHLARELAVRTHFDGPTVLSWLDSRAIAVTPGVREYLQGVRHWGEGHKISLRSERELKEILERAGYSAEEIALIVRIGNKEIFDLPYDRRERFKAIHPGRMVKLLADKRCLTKRSAPPTLEKLIAL